MKKIFILFCALLFTTFIRTHAQSQNLATNDINKALLLDGKDNNVRTGIGIIHDKWTLEAWIKSDGKKGEEYQAIVAGGEYSKLNICDNLPLVIKDGRLHCKGANIFSPSELDNEWHHVVATCDGRQTKLYIDGINIAQADTAISILPGAIGVHNYKYTFGGLIDEVRIWTVDLSDNTIKEWMGKPIRPNHPDFNQLKGYYNFDDLKDEISINWVGKGHQSYHIRNGRNNYYGSKLMAYTVNNDNPHFMNYNGNQVLFNAVVIQNEWDADQGSKDNQALKLRIAVNGSDKPMSLNELNLDLFKTSSLSDISKVHVYYTGQYPRSDTKIELFGKGTSPKKIMIFRGKNDVFLAPGINYFLVTFDVKKEAVVNNTLSASVTSFKLDNTSYTPETDTDYVAQKITLNSGDNPDILKVLQWNIWHGGVHLGKTQGQGRVIDLIRASNADIVTMQEAYGSQDTIAKAIGFHMQSNSLKDNLALFSRYPMAKIKPKETFKSNPAKILLPNGKQIIVNDCWLRYAYRPEYTSVYANTGLNPNAWIAEDSTLSLIDITNILATDINPYLETSSMPVIVAGDFNSGSHLDWTAKAKALHMGYGPVAFPTSQYMLNQGYKDSFREINPDEVSYQGGTFAVIFGQIQTSRIDYIYYKGSIRVISSKIIRSAPQIDDVWASDHAAVLTTFDTR